MKLLAGWLILAGATLGAKAPAATPPPSFGEVVEVDIVNVEVYATDRDGNRVKGLQKGDFSIFEDGKPVEITNFEAVERAALPLPAAPHAGPASTAPEAPLPARPEAGLSLVVLVDNFHLRPAHRTMALEQVRKFLAQQLAPGDQAMLATYDLTINIRQGFTSDRALLETALHAAESLPTYAQQQDSDRKTALEAMYALYGQDPCGYAMVSPIESYASTVREESNRTLSAMKMLVASLAGVPGRKALLMVSDGIAVNPGEELYQAFFEVCSGTATSGLPTTMSNDSPLSSRYPVQQALIDAQKLSVADKIEELAAHANASRVTIYTLQASGLQGVASSEAGLGTHERVLQMPSVQSVQTTNDRNSLVAMAADTGGRAMLDVNDFLPELARMQEDFSSYYSLGYSPSHRGDGRQHRIEVKLKRPGVRMRYRQSYRDKPLLERVADRTLSALFYASEDNPLDIEMTLGEQTPDSAGGTWTVPVRLKIPLFKLAFANQQGEIFQGRLRLFVSTRSSQGALSPLRQVEVPLSIPHNKVLYALGQHYLYTLTLKLPAGEHRVAVAVRDELGATTSYLTRAFAVGPVPGAAAPAANR